MFEVCDRCGMPLATQVEACPKCGAPIKNPVTLTRVAFSLTALFVVVVRALD